MCICRNGFNKRLEIIPVYKITILGDAGVGKTTLRRQFMGEKLKKDYGMTIGADFSVYKIEDYILHIWDLAGQMRFNRVIGSYFRGTLGSLLIFDITRNETFNSLPNWINELVTNNGNKMVPIVLVGNKVDLKGTTWDSSKSDVATEYTNRLSEWSNFDVPYVETSAVTGLNVDIIFQKLVARIDQAEGFNQ